MSQVRKSVFMVMFFLLLAWYGTPLRAQTDSGSLRGQVTDPSGGAIANATVVAIGPSGAASTATTNLGGFYELKGLLPGKYTLKVTAPNFAPLEQPDIEVVAGKTRKADATLSIAAREEKVMVNDQAAAALDVNPASNAGAIVIQGKDLEALSDDPDELQSDLQALAGPSAGPNGGQIFIDGFTGGQLPPKASIREIRINQNPFSAEYDRLGFGRIEILTKPGTDQFHGRAMVMGNSSSFNSKSPFVAVKLPYHSTQYAANVSGPVAKNTSFLVSVEHRNINDSAIVNAQILDPNSFPPFTEAVDHPQVRTEVNTRLDFQLAANNTLTTRYQYEGGHQNNGGIGQFTLPENGYNDSDREHVVQIGDTQIFGGKIVNETRFQYVRTTSGQIPLSTAVTINVPGFFTSGGNGGGRSTNLQHRYELQNYTSMAKGAHFLKFGGRLRGYQEEDTSTANFNGTFTFRKLADYQSGTPEQFKITTGSPSANVGLVDVGVYFQDDWRFRPNMTFSYGLRYETQNYIHDNTDFSPRLGFAWGLGGGRNKAAKTILRAGFGMFYDRFGENLALQAERVNGVLEQQIIIKNPTFYPCSTLSCIQGTNTNVVSRYQVGSNLRAPYAMQGGVTLEQQLTKTANLSVTYLKSRGLHQFLINNINTPLPGTFNPGDPNSGIRPFGNVGNIFQYQSDGTYKQNQLIVNGNVRMAKLTLFGFYSLSYVDTNASGAGGGGFGGRASAAFTSNPYNLNADYGRASYDIRHRVFTGGSISLPHGVSFSPFLVAQSGPPFNISVPTDLLGTSVFNQRPSFASSLSNPANVVVKPGFGAFNTVPVPGETIVPVNYLTAARLFSLNARVSKTFGFGRRAEGSGGAMRGGTFGGRGPGGPGGGPVRMEGGHGGPGGPMGGGGASGQRYSLTVAVNARNVFNIVNTNPPSGVVTSSFFGVPNSLAGGRGPGGFFSSGTAPRKIELMLMFNF